MVPQITIYGQVRVPIYFALILRGAGNPKMSKYTALRHSFQLGKWQTKRNVKPYNIFYDTCIKSGQNCHENGHLYKGSV